MTVTTDHSRIPIVQGSYQLTLNMQRLVAKFPRNIRYQLGDRLACMMHDFFEAIVKANFTRDPKARVNTLDALSATLFSIRMLVRMAKDLKAISHGEFGEANSHIEDIQKQLTGWTKWTKSKLPQSPREAPHP